MSSRPLRVFLVAVLGGSWCLAGAYFLLGGKVDSLAFLLLAIPYMWLPGLASLRLARSVGVARAELGLKVAFDRWIGIAVVFPLAVVAAALVVSWLIPGVAAASGYSDIAQGLGELPQREADFVRAQLDFVGPLLPLVLGAIAIGSSVFFGTTINALVALGEEIAWRGYLPRLLPGLGFWTQSIVIGVIWGIWHLPLILGGHNYPQHPRLGAMLMIVFTILLSPWLLWLRQRSGSLLAPAVAHGVLNAAAGTTYVFIDGGSELTVGTTGAAGLLVLVAANLLLAWLRRCRVGSSPAGGALSELPN